MKRLQILIALFVFIFLSATGQDSLKGKWYMFSRNRIIELNILSDKVISKQLNWDLSDRNRSEPDTQFIKSIRKANGNIYLYLNNSKRTANQILLNTIKVVRPSKEILIALNGTEKLFADTTAVDQYVQNDLEKKYGMPLYSESEIQKLKGQKKVEEMTEADFKTYADKFLMFKAELDSLSKVSISSNGLLYYGYAMMRIIFGQLGYNPLVTNDEFEKFILRFKNNPETKAIVSKLLDEN